MSKFKVILAHITAGLAADMPVLLSPGPFDATKVGLLVSAFCVGAGLLAVKAPKVSP